MKVQLTFRQMSSKAVVASREPIEVELKKGEEYYWCRCGRSKNQPWCDGSHAGTSFTPLAFKAKADGKQLLCQCKQTGDAPFCDFTHAGLPDEPKEEEKGKGKAKFEPIIAGRGPVKVNLVEGKDVYWCACGRSKNQPFCDGSHKGTGITPFKFTPTESGDGYMCMCKRTKNPPFCDGSHAKLPSEQDIEDTVPDASKSGGGGGASSSVPVGATREEPTLAYIKELAREGLTSHHGPMQAMGVPGPTLPRWDDIQLVVAQLATKPLMDDARVSTEVVIGPNAKKPLRLALPVFVSDMSFGALSEEAKTALARGAELAGTGICSGEGGMLPAEQEANTRYLFELGTAKFGFDMELLKRVQAFHFKGGQAAKTGTGGHLPGKKVTAQIAAVRSVPEGKDAISPPTFVDLVTPADFKRLADEVREVTGGIPIGFKLSAQHIEADIDFALEASADYIILDGRGGATGAAPTIFRDNISVPTIPALARARRHLDARGRKDVSLVITGGLRTPADFIKALCLGADAVAVANSALQAIGCVAARMCNTNMCPAGIATQRKDLRVKLNVEKSSKQLFNFLDATRQLMQVMARACGYDDVSKFNVNDLTTWKRDMADLSGVRFGGVGTQ